MQITRTDSLVVLILFFCLTMHTVIGQNGNYNLGARSAALGEASISISDQWAIFNNVAGISEERSSSVLFTYQNRYNTSAFNAFGAALIKPLSFGVTGMSAYRFGDDLFSEQKLSLSFADKIGIVSLGSSINYVQYKIETAGSRGLLSFDFGGIVSFGDQLYFGAYISNINQAKVSNFENENLPTIMKAGITYNPIQTLMINVEIEKDLDFEEQFKTGIEYKFYKEFYARTGFHTQPFHSSFGLGFRPKKILVDYAFSNNSSTGDIHELSVVYLIGMKR